MIFTDICEALKIVFDKSVRSKLEYFENKIYFVKLYDDVIIMVKADSYEDAKKRIYEVLH